MVSITTSAHRTAAILAICALLLSACASETSTPSLSVTSKAAFVHIAATEPADRLVSLTSHVLDAASDVVVSADLEDPAELKIAQDLGLPLLPDTPAGESLREDLGADVAADDAPKATAPTSADPSLVIFKDEPSAAETHLLEITGSRSIVSSKDPRTDTELAAAIGEHERVIVVNNPRYQAEVVYHEAKVVGDQYLLLDNQHFAAMYGHPAGPALGVLGEQNPKKSVARVKLLVDKYEKSAPDVQFQPAFEIIATIATAGPGKHKDYSGRTPISELRPLVDIAKENGVTVVLDLQPGRGSMLEQAKYYEELLLEPHVGLALDPEWKLGKKDKHLVRIGHVTAKQVNEVSTWLAELTRENVLPQKMFVLHQFQTKMIRNRDKVNTSHPELATVIHVDGQGPTGAKISTWNHIRKDSPVNVAWGWKNFVDEDVPMLTTTQTWKQVKPHPALITYQ